MSKELMDLLLNTKYQPVLDWIQSATNIKQQPIP